MTTEEEMAMDPAVIHTGFRSACKRRENADAADLRQADYLESDSFFKLVKCIFLVTSKKQAQ